MRLLTRRLGSAGSHGDCTSELSHREHGTAIYVRQRIRRVKTTENALEIAWKLPGNGPSHSGQCSHAPVVRMTLAVPASLTSTCSVPPPRYAVPSNHRALICDDEAWLALFQTVIIARLRLFVPCSFTRSCQRLHPGQCSSSFVSQTLFHFSCFLGHIPSPPNTRYRRTRRPIRSALLPDVLASLLRFPVSVAKQQQPTPSQSASHLHSSSRARLATTFCSPLDFPSAPATLFATRVGASLSLWKFWVSVRPTLPVLRFALPISLHYLPS